MNKIHTLFNTPVVMEPQKVTIRVGNTPIEIALGIDEQGRTTAKKLYAFLELNATHYSRWCRRCITENDFAEENVDFIVLAIDGENPKGGRPTQDYLLTATFAKKLAMVSSSDRGEQAREYFIKVEEQLKTIAMSMGAPNLGQGTSITQQESRVTLDEIMLLSRMQATTRYNLGAATIRKVADECGAIVHIGKRVVYHRQILDDYFMSIAEQKAKSP